MQEISTPKPVSSSSLSSSHDAQPRPKKLTIEFLRQFARCYSPQGGLRSSLADVVVN